MPFSDWSLFESNIGRIEYPTIGLCGLNEEAVCDKDFDLSVGNSIKGSVTRFGEISSLGKIFKKLWAIS